MKKILAFGLIIGPLIGSGQEKSYSVEGKLENVHTPVEKLYLQFRKNGAWVRDSSEVKQGRYAFRGQIQEPELATLMVASPKPPAGQRPQMLPLFLDQGRIRLVHTDSLKNVQVTGSRAHQDYSRLEEAAKPFQQRLELLYKDYSAARKTGDAAQLAGIEKQIEAISDELRTSVYSQFVKNNPASPAALYALRQFAGYDINAGEVEPLLESLDPALKAYPSAVELQEKVVIAKKTAVGQMAMEFVQNDTSGNPVALSSFRGKYLLIDFWASWCGPCRQENPNLVKAFETYRDKGFTVLGVSLDRPNARDKWIKAIHDDKLFWTQVSDLQFWENAVAKLYGIQAIPQNLLLDPTGKIIARNLRGEDLQNKLRELF